MRTWATRKEPVPTWPDSKSKTTSFNPISRYVSHVSRQLASSRIEFVRISSRVFGAKAWYESQLDLHYWNKSEDVWSKSWSSCLSQLNILMTWCHMDTITTGFKKICHMDPYLEMPNHFKNTLELQDVRSFSLDIFGSSCPWHGVLRRATHILRLVLVY